MPISVTDDDLVRVQWTWAKTYALTAPHWYILKEQYPGFYWRMAKSIEEGGVRREFRHSGRFFRYLVIREYQYWIIGTVVNKALKDAR